MNMKNRSGMQGFTLIELMIVVSIIAILAAVAWVNYQNYVIETRWSEAKSFLEQVMHQEEKFYTENLTYTTNMQGDGTTTGLGFGAASPKSENEHYQITAASCGGGLTIVQCVQLTATPISDSQKDDERCKNFILNSQGKKDVSVVNAVAECW